jgi:excisionase family DNA binding protein
MGEERRDALTIRQAAALLGVHPNTIRNRVKARTYAADKVQTENGETYLIPRSELARDSTANNLVRPTQSQPLPDVREAMQAMLEPFVRELGDVREELGREKERRERAEERIEELERQQEQRESPETVEEASEGSEPRSYTPGSQEPPQRQQGGGLRGLRRRILGW